MTGPRDSEQVGSTQVLRRTSASLTEVELDGEASVFHPETDRVVMLNTSATVVWRLVDGRRDARAIAAEVAERFGIDEATARSGVALALDQLVAEHLVEPAEPVEP